MTSATKPGPAGQQRNLVPSAAAPAQRTAEPAIPLADRFRALGEIVATYSLDQLDSKPPFERALMLAEGIGKLREAITADVLKMVLSVKDTRLGFRTDRPPGSKEEQDKKPYAVETIRDVFIEATLRGAYPVGNEFNVIASGCYLTKEYYERKVCTFPGLTNLRLEIGVPSGKDGGALVPMKATWVLDGRAMSLTCQVHKNGDGTEVDERIPVRVNQGQSVDAIIGKATRKLLFRIYYDLRGVAAEGSQDDDVIEGTVVAPEPITKPEIANLEEKGRILKMTAEDWAGLLQSRGATEIGELTREAAEVLIVDLQQCIENMPPARELGQEG